MDDRLKKVSPSKLILVIAWTLLLTLLLLVFDRGLFGPKLPEGWNDLKTLENLKIVQSKTPTSVRPPQSPLYLPNTLLWPPIQIFYRSKPTVGWWLGLQSRQNLETILWFGTGTPPLPKALTMLLPCMSEHSYEKCPEGWKFSSIQRNAETIKVFSKLSSLETKRILIGLEYEGAQ